MKRILITGATSWIGSEVEAHLAAFPGMYGVERVSLRGDAWKDRSWEGFDSVVHLAAVVHESGKAGGMGGLYDEVNVALVRQAALKAKTEGVPHFAFLSSFSVYGAEEGGVEEVDLGAVPRPSTLYGKSKLAAERVLEPLAESAPNPLTHRFPFRHDVGNGGNGGGYEHAIAQVHPRVQEARGRAVQVDGGRHLCPDRA